MTTGSSTFHYILIRDFLDNYKFFKEHYNEWDIVWLKKFKKEKENLYCVRKIFNIQTYFDYFEIENIYH